MTKTTEISNTDDYIDSRDVIERFEYLTDEIQDSFTSSWSFDLVKAFEANGNKTESIVQRLIDRDNLDSWIWDEWKLIKTLIDELSDHSEWKYGLSLISDDYMDEDWAEQELKDLGMLPRDLSWVVSSNINWESVLSDLQQDYTSFDFDGNKYWYRDC